MVRVLPAPPNAAFLAAAATLHRGHGSLQNNPKLVAALLTRQMSAALPATTRQKLKVWNPSQSPMACQAPPGVTVFQLGGFPRKHLGWKAVCQGVCAASRLDICTKQHFVAPDDLAAPATTASSESEPFRAFCHEWQLRK